MNLGFNAEHFTYTGTHVAPRWMLNLQPIAGHVVRVGTTTGYRNPSMFEQNGDIRIFSRLSNSTPLDWLMAPAGVLRPERFFTREVSYYGEIRPIALTVDARAYDERATDLLRERGRGLPPGSELDSNNRANIYENSQAGRLRGLEYQVRYRPVPTTWFMATQAWQHVSSQDAGLRRSVPVRSLGLHTAHRFDNGITVSAHHWRIGAQEWLGFGEAVPAYKRFDWRIGYDFRLGDHRAEVALVTHNQGRPYQDYRLNYWLERRLFATIRIDSR